MVEANQKEKLFSIRAMNMGDYSDAICLWQKTPGIVLSDADAEDQMDLFLLRNQGLSFVAETDTQMIGTMLCGHDGRRGFIYHLAVRELFRRNGVGRALVTCSLNRLAAEGIKKCHLFVVDGNVHAMAFWRDVGFSSREDICIYSKKC